MSEAIIVLNAGSSSLKFSIYQIADDDLTPIARGEVEGLGGAARFKAKDRQGSVLKDEELSTPSDASFDHEQAFDEVAQWVRAEFGGVLFPVAIGHRVVHGGSEFTAPTVLTSKVVQALDRLVPLAPLHQPHNLAGVRAVRKLRPDLPQVACFDTAFHHGRATVVERFALPDECYQRGVRRWGFHGLSYESVVDTLRGTVPELVEGKIVVAHLGNGASMCAIKGGRSVDTSMGFSTLDGLPMGTRCGSLDPGALLFLMQSRSHAEVENLLYEKSGLLGISGVSNDVRELLASTSPRAAEAIEYFVYRAVREIGSLAAALGGLDALIFTAGIGENSPLIRSRICREVGWLGVALDAGSNERGRGCISPAGRSPSVWVVPSNEERVIATGTWSALRAAQEKVSRSSPRSGGRPK